MMTAPIKKKALVVVAHPDDEILGCGGFISKMCEQQCEVHVLYLNNGCDFRKDFSASVVKEQIKEVSEILGFTPHIQNFRTGYFDQYPVIKLVKEISSVITDVQPEILLTHDETDLHQDHLHVNKAVRIAARFKPTSPVRTLMTFPVISSSEINPSFGFNPNYFVDIAEHLEAKHLAMTCYKDELASFQELRGEQGMEGWARFYGMHIGVEYAEGFKVIRSCS